MVIAEGIYIYLSLSLCVCVLLYVTTVDYCYNYLQVNNIVC